MTAVATPATGVNDLPPDMLAAAIRREVRAAVFPTLVEARRLIGEAGIAGARRALADALDALDAANHAYRVAKAAQDVADEDHAQAVLDAEWTLDGRFVVEGNKTWLITGPCPACGGAKEHPTGVIVPDDNVCGGPGEVRKAMTADERKAWKAAEARKMPDVAEAAAAARNAAEATAAARDAVTSADKRIGAARADLDAAVATLNTLTAGLAAGRA